MSMTKALHRGLTPELIKRAREELGETDEKRVQGIKELKRLIKEEPDFNPCTDDAFLTRFLRAKKYNIERAFHVLKNYYRYKAQNSGILHDLKLSDFSSKERIQGTYLEYRDQNDSLVGYIRLGKIDTDKHSPEEVLSYVLLLTEIILDCEPTQITGYSLILDYAGFNLRKAKRYSSIPFLKKVVDSIQETYPSRIKAFHFLNEPIYIDVIHRIFRSFLSEKLKKRIHFHGKDLDSLHKFVKPNILPAELGGEQGPAEIYEKKFFEIACEYEDHFIRMNKYGYTGKTLQKLRKGN